MALHAKETVLLLPAEVGMLFGVGPKTTLRWSEIGKLDSVKTPGGHRRFRAEEVRRVLIKTHEGPDLERRLKDLDDLLEARR